MLYDDADASVVLAHRWRIQPSRTGSVFYAITTIGKSTKSMHILLMGPGVDHVNHDGLDNRRKNLRRATSRQNAGNKRGHRATSSRFRGVSWNAGCDKWQASINKRYLGLFGSEEEAAAMWDQEARKLWGEFAFQNLAGALS